MDLGRTVVALGSSGTMVSAPRIGFAIFATAKITITVTTTETMNMVKKPLPGVSFLATVRLELFDLEPVLKTFSESVCGNACEFTPGWLNTLIPLDVVAGCKFAELGCKLPFTFD